MQHYQIISNMKKLYLLGAFIAVAVLTALAVVTLPYTFDFPSSLPTTANDDSWCAKNNGTGNSWQAWSGSSEFRLWVAAADADSRTQDAWLISPTFETEKDSEYKITFAKKLHQSEAHVDNFEGYFSHVSPFDASFDASNATQLFALTNMSGNDAGATTTTEVDYTATATEDGKGYFLFHVTGKVSTGLYLCPKSIVKVGAETEEPGPEEPGEDYVHDDDNCQGITELPYSKGPAASSSALETGWTKVNNNADDREWLTTTDSNTPVAYIQYTNKGKGPHDDDLFSPRFHLEKDKEYVISYEARATTTTFPERLTVYLTTSNVPKQILESKVVYANDPISTTSYEKFGSTVTPEVTGDYYVVFHAHSDEDRNKLYVRNFSIVEFKFQPASVTDLVATPDENKALSCKLTWTLPTTDIFNNQLPADKPITAVKVYRDEEGTAIATLGASATEFVDTDNTGLEVGKHTYHVSVVADGVESEKASVETAYIGEYPAQDIPYEGFAVNAAGTEFNDGWTTINMDARSKAWEPYSSEKYEGHPTARIFYDGSYTKDDYLISCALNLEAGKSYVIQYPWKTQTDKESIDVLLSKGTTTSDFENAVKLEEFSEKTQTSWVVSSQRVSVEETGKYYVVFHAKSPANRYGIFVSKLIVTEYKFAPAPVQNLKAERGADRALTCKLSWAVEETDYLGNPLPDDKPIEKIEIFRDEETQPVKVFTEKAEEFEDTETTGLTGGVHTYTVIVTAGGVQSAAETAECKYVGPYPAVSMPAHLNLNDYDADMWSIISGEEHNGATFYKNASGNFYYSSYSSNYGDQYIVTPSVKIEKPGYYRFDIVGRKNYNYPSTWSVLMGTTPNPAEMTAVIGDFDMPNSTDYISHVNDFYVETPGTYYFAVHLISNKQSNTYYVTAVDITESHFIPGVVTALAATPDADGANKMTVSWTNPTKDFAGRSMSADKYKVEIYLNDEETPVATVTDGSTSVVVEVENSGIYTVTVKTVGTDENADSAPASPSVQTNWVGEKKCTVPYNVNFNSTNETINFWMENIVNGNNDDYAFYYNKGSSYAYFELKKGADSYNDFVLSPVLKINKGYVAISFDYMGGTGSIPVTVHVGMSKANQFNPNDFANTTFADQEVVMQTGTSTSYIEDYTFVAKIEEDGEYQFYFGVTDALTGNWNEPEFRSFEIKYYTAYPADVTDLACAAVEGSEDSVELTWVNPTKVYKTNIDYTDELTMVVERDGEVIATLTEETPGESASYVDENVSAGYHTYMVYGVVDGKGHAGTYPSVKSPWMGQGLNAPIHHTKKDHFDGWTIDDVANDAGSNPCQNYWAWDTYDQAWRIYNYSLDIGLNDYLISVPLTIENNVVYKVTLNSKFPATNHGIDYAVNVKMGTEGDHKLMADVHTITGSSAEGLEYVDHVFYVHATNEETPAEVKRRVGEADGDSEDETEAPNATSLTAQDYIDMAKKIKPGVHRVAIHINQRGSMFVKEFHMEEVVRDGNLTGIEAVEAGKVMFDGKGLCFSGEADVKVFNVAGACVASVTAHDGFSFEGFAAGYYIVKVTAAGETTTLKVAVK